MVRCVATPARSSLVLPRRLPCLAQNKQNNRFVSCGACASQGDVSRANRRAVLAVVCTGVALASGPQSATADDAVAGKCFMDMTVDGKGVGRVVIDLSDPASLGARRFSDLCKTIQGVGYRRSKFDGIFEVCPLHFPAAYMSCLRGR